MTAQLQHKTNIVDLRQQLIRAGYVAIPVDGKRPRIAKWSALRPTVDNIAELSQEHPDHRNTGLLTGDVIAIDIDVLDLDTALALEDMVTALPGGDRALRRVGRAPKSLFLFRAVEPCKKIETAEYLIAGEKCQIEVLGAGQQFVAFGTHPETGVEYEWTTESPLQVDFTDLPELAVDTLTAFMVRAEALLASAGEPVRKKTAARPPSTAGSTFWQQVNSAALANADAWVRELFATATQEAGTGAWRVSSASLGRALQEDISIHADGIQDFGLEQPETPISLVEKYGGAPSVKDAAIWLCERLGRDPADFGWQVRKPVEIRFGASKEPPQAANDDDADVEDLPLPEPDAGGLPEHLCFPPGAVGDFARFTVSCARFPSPHLALVSALAFTAGLVGRRYKGPTGLRSNLYIVGLAESGFGKDITIRTSEALADSTVHGSGVSQKLFMDKIRSMPGIAGKLRKTPSCVAVQDEFGRWLAEHTGKNVATHKAEIASALMELTGAPAGSWGGMEKAEGNIARIIQPCFSIHGISTPSTFWGALGSSNISEGLLPRMVLIDVGNREPVKVREPAGDLDNIPADLSEKVAMLLGGQSQYHGPFYAMAAKSDEKPFPMVTVGTDEGVRDFFEEFDDRVRAMKSSIDRRYWPILNRVGENAARLAMIVAVGCDPRSPIITMDIQQWANEVAEHSLRVILKGADTNIADNDRQAEYLRVRAMIERKGKEGMKHAHIIKNLKGSIPGPRLDDILSMLRQSGEVFYAECPTKSGQKMTRFWMKGSLPKEAKVVP
jgi:hypothetical protein